MKLVSLLVCSALLACAPTAHAQLSRDEVVATLLKQDYRAIEASFDAVQHRFEIGELSEYDLRRAFEPFAKLKNAQALDNLRAWAADSPRSYVAHLALGLNYRASGSAARGKKYWDDTTPEQRDGLFRNFSLAEPELRTSIALTRKPYLSLLNLMTINGSAGSRPFLNAALLLANEALPSNQLARLNYGRFLLPRWGGSYEKFEAFVALCRAQGVDDSTLLKLRAIVLNDRGMVARAEHDDVAADALFTQALEVARQSGDEGNFRSTYLVASLRRICTPGVDKVVCRPADADSTVVASSARSMVEGSSGEDIDHAIVIPTDDHVEGVRTEYAWLALHYPKAKRTSQALVPRGERQYDMLGFTTVDGRELKVYFDITGFYVVPNTSRSGSQGERQSLQ